MRTAASTLPKILLIDHNRDGLLVRKSVLEEVGYQVHVAYSGEEALKCFETAVFAVVVTDYLMPKMNGVELIVRLRQRDPNTRIILLSGFVEPLGLTEESTGADAVIAKSANEAAHLTRWVKRLVNRTTARKPPGSQGNGAAKKRAASR